MLQELPEWNFPEISWNLVIGLSGSGTHSLHSSVSHTCNTFRSVKLLIERGTRVSALPRRSNFFKPARFPTLLGKVVNWLFGRNILLSEESLPRDVGSLLILLSQTHNDCSEQSFCIVSGSCLRLLSQMLNFISLSRFPIDSECHSQRYCPGPETQERQDFQ